MFPHMIFISSKCAFSSLQPATCNQGYLTHVFPFHRRGQAEKLSRVIAIDR